MFKDIIWNIFYNNDKEFVLSKIDTDEQLELCRKESIILQRKIDELSEGIIQINELVSIQNKTIESLTSKAKKETELESYWNSKRPKTIWLYPGRPSPTSNGNMYIDPRIFFQYDRTLPKMTGIDNDEKANKALGYVHNVIRYISDSKEYWQFSYETMRRKGGDCEDGAILMANIMLMSGIPYWRIRLNAGNVKGGGHAYVTYLREKDDKWYVLDWCYWYSESINYRKTWKKAEKYFSIWGSWNTKYVFGELPKEE